MSGEDSWKVKARKVAEESALAIQKKMEEVEVAAALYADRVCGVTCETHKEWKKVKNAYIAGFWHNFK